MTVTRIGFAVLLGISPEIIALTVAAWLVRRQIAFLVIWAISRSRLAVSLLLLALAASAQEVNVVSTCGLSPAGTVDNSAAFRTCLAAHPAASFYFPAAALRSPSNYLMGSTVKLSRLQAIRGDGAAITRITGGSATGPVLVFADANPQGYPDSDVLSGITVACGASTPGHIGVYLGGDPAGVLSPANWHGDHTNIVGSRITGCDHAVRWGNNSWGTVIDRTSVFANVSGLVVMGPLSNSGELVTVINSRIFNNSHSPIWSNIGWEWAISNTEFDFNGQPFWFNGGGSVAIDKSHFEGVTAPFLLSTGGNGRLSIRDSTMLIDPTTVSFDDLIQISSGNMHLDLDNLNVFSSAPVKQMVNWAGNLFDQISNIQANTNKIARLLSTDPITIVIYNTPYANENNSLVKVK